MTDRFDPPTRDIADRIQAQRARKRKRYTFPSHRGVLSLSPEKASLLPGR